MKIEIDLNNSLELKGQFEAVDIYIRANIESTIEFNCWGEPILDEKNQIVFGKVPVLKTTPKNTGMKIETSFKNYHVSCYKTKGGMYKFKVWGV